MVQPTSSFRLRCLCLLCIADLRSSALPGGSRFVCFLVLVSMDKLFQQVLHAQFASSS